MLWTVGVVSGCGQWVVELLDYLIMKYPYSYCFALFYSLIPTSFTIFLILVVYRLLDLDWAVYAGLI